MKRKLSLLLVLTLLCTLFAMPVSAAEVEPSNYADNEIVVAGTSGTNYFSGTTTKMNSFNGLEAVATRSSGSCSSDERSITSVSVYCNVSSGSSSFKLYVISPSGTVAYKNAGTSNATYNFTEFNGEDPYGKWTIKVVTNGTVSTVTATLKVNYLYSYN